MLKQPMENQWAVGHINGDCAKGNQSTQCRMPSDRGAAVVARAAMSKYFK